MKIAKANRLASCVVALALFLGIGGASLFFVVDQREYAVVSSIGGVKQIIQAPGLYMKWPAPLERVAFIDKRTQIASPPESMRFETRDKKSVALDVYIRWRVTDPHLYFLNYHQNTVLAENALRTGIRAQLTPLLAQHTLLSLANIDYSALADTVRTQFQKENASAPKRLANQIPSGASNSYKGIEILNIYLQRPDLRAQAIQSRDQAAAGERAQIVETLRAQSAAEIEAVQFDALREREQIMLDAYEQAQIVEGEGDAQAAAIEAEAARSAPEFYAFYKNLRALQRSVNEQDVLLVDPVSSFKIQGKSEARTTPK